MTSAIVTFVSYIVGRAYDDALNYMVPFAVPVAQPIYFLGVEYASSGRDNATASFLEDFRSRIFLPYREGFESIALPGEYNHTKLTSDTGWGCAIRSTQMLVAQALVDIRLGREFRSAYATPDQLDEVLRIAWRFADIREGELSIHRMVSFGLERLGKPPGTWFGPSSGAVAVSSLWFPTNSIGVLYSSDGTIVIPEIFESLQSRPEGTIVLVGLRLGMHTTDLGTYKEELLRLFRQNLFQGMVGGDGIRAFYIPAASETHLYYMDPHTVRPALNDASRIRELLVSMTAPYKMRWERLDPQISLAFSIRSADDARNLIDFMRTSILLNVVDARPTEPVWVEDRLSASSDDEVVLEDNHTTYV